MHRIAKLVLQGLAAVLPLGLTLYFIYWLLSTIEALAKPVLLSFIPAHSYFPGLGLLTGFIVLFLAGLLVNAYAIRYLVNLGEGLMERIPLVKSVYGALHDMMSMFHVSGDNQMKSVVAVDIDKDTTIIGLVTGEGAGERLFGDDRIGVYLPLSYQIGGLTVYVPRSRVRPLDISIEEGMRIALTGGAQNTRGKKSE